MRRTTRREREAPAVLLEIRAPARTTPRERGTLRHHTHRVYRVRTTPARAASTQQDARERMGPPARGGNTGQKAADALGERGSPRACGRTPWLSTEPAGGDHSCAHGTAATAPPPITTWKNTRSEDAIHFS